jgi:hypothetical protein
MGILGGHKEVSSILADQQRSRLRPNAGGGGGGVADFRGLSQRVQLYTGARINFGVQTPYLTFRGFPRQFSEINIRNQMF